jgi:hypothetical protein
MALVCVCDGDVFVEFSKHDAMVWGMCRSCERTTEPFDENTADHTVLDSFHKKYQEEYRQKAMKRIPTSW